ncbi:MAG: type II toxin-antitoxin system VapC family toxin [Candidatus Dormibacteraceae bacterium]
MILLDANVLVYASDSAAPQHANCYQLLQRSMAGEIPAILVPQVLMECYSVITSPRRQSILSARG